MAGITGGGLQAFDRPIAVLLAQRIVLAFCDTACGDRDDIIIKRILPCASDALYADKLALGQIGIGYRIAAGGRYGT
ncbi:hypothetical protein XGA_0148 [Xanthomonas hortorum ATCC 19865]|nr:hypothetical protein XGA_0148 [Xanthomonas hortorum ATCC 19865]